MSQHAPEDEVHEWQHWGTAQSRARVRGVAARASTTAELATLRARDALCLSWEGPRPGTRAPHPAFCAHHAHRLRPSLAACGSGTCARGEPDTRRHGVTGMRTQLCAPACGARGTPYRLWTLQWRGAWPRAEGAPPESSPRWSTLHDCETVPRARGCHAFGLGAVSTGGWWARLTVLTLRNNCWPSNPISTRLGARLDVSTGTPVCGIVEQTSEG